MERIKAALRRVFCLPPLPTVLIAVPSYVLVAFVLWRGGGHDALAYLSYGLSAYALVLTVTGTVRAVKCGLGRMRRSGALERFPLLKRYCEDRLFRTEVGLYIGTAINFAYIFLKLAMGLRYRSVWFIALAVYYLFLVVTRLPLLRYLRSARPGENVRAELALYRRCGAFLLLLNLALSVMVTLVVMLNEGFRYNGHLIYIMAIYSFYCMITSALNVKGFRRYNSPVLSAAKAVSLMTAMVSMLALETAMIAQFGDEGDTFRRAMTGTTGFVVCAFVLGMAVYMIVTAGERLHAAENREEYRHG